MAVTASETENLPGMMRNQRSVWLLMAGAAVVLVAGVIVALVSSHQKEATYPPGSPQQTVATYFRLLQAGKVGQAYALTDFPVGRFPSRSSNLAQFHQQWDSWNENSHRVTLVQTTTSGATATVTVDVSSFSGGPFGATDQSTRQTLTLRRKKGAWRITGPMYSYLP